MTFLLIVIYPCSAWNVLWLPAVSASLPTLPSCPPPLLVPHPHLGLAKKTCQKQETLVKCYWRPGASFSRNSFWELNGKQSCFNCGVTRVCQDCHCSHRRSEPWYRNALRAVPSHPCSTPWLRFTYSPQRCGCWTYQDNVICYLMRQVLTVRSWEDLFMPYTLMQSHVIHATSN